MHQQRLRDSAATVIRISDWLESAVCCIATFYQHLYTYRKVCTYCYSISNPALYVAYIKTRCHYVHFGSSEGFEICEECETIIPRFQSIDQCLECHYAISDLVEYLDDSQERPYDRATPTNLIISVREYNGIAA